MGIFIMPSSKCYVCGKTAYPLESYSAADNTFHKLCFRCKECNVTLNVGTFKAFEGSVYCSKCIPKPSATAVADDFKVKNALNAPKRKAEGLGAVQKGTGDKAVGVGLDSMSVKTATSAPKKVTEGLGGVQKGSGDKAVGVGLDSTSVKAATSAPKAVAESLGNVQKGSGDKAVGVGLDSMSVQSATSAPKAVSEGVPISARTGATAAQDQPEVAGAPYDDEEAEADDE